MTWTTKATARTRATPEQVWRLWTDVAGWSRWDEEVAWSRLDGAFETGTAGALKPRVGPTTRFVLTAVEPQVAFTSRSSLPLTTFDIIHTLHLDGGETVIEHRLQMTGPLAFLFSRLIGAGVARALPGIVERLARTAEGAAS
jgi:hypothetical protein